MTLRLELISEHRKLVGDDVEISFGPDGGTIGRSLENDWVLPDTERFVSGRHATIDHRAGAYYLADVSSNGVYVNGSVEPLGKGNPRRLFDGDHLRMGNFEMRVHLDEGEDLSMPPAPAPSVVPDHIEQLVPVDDMPSSIKLLDEEEITGDSVFSEAFLRGHTAEDRPTPPRQEPNADNARPARARPAGPGPAQHADLLDVLLRAAGVDPNDIHPSVDRVELVTNAGRVLGEMVGGITELLASRANFKGMFRLDQTTVLPRHNNPLKLSASRSESLKQLLVGREGDYLGPLSSVREACRDLRHHQDALVAGMIRAFREYVERLDPGELEEQYRQSTNRKPLFEGLARRKYWEYYCDLYPVLTQEGNASLPQQYSEDFVRHYEKQLADYERTERAMGDTQKLDPRPPPTTAQAPAGEPAGDTLPEVVEEWLADEDPTGEVEQLVEEQAQARASQG